MAKSDPKDINQTHPMLGYRVKNEIKVDLMKLLKQVVKLYNDKETEVGKTWKPTELFHKALRIGLEELKRRKSG